jgi:Ca-activated chloride channel family protein
MRQPAVALLALVGFSCLSLQSGNTTEPNIPEAVPMRPAAGYAPPVSPRELPYGQAVVNMGCFGRSREEGSIGYAPRSPAPMGGAQRSVASAPKSAPAKSAAPPPAPTPSAAPAGAVTMGSSSGAVDDRVGAGRASRDEEAEAAPPQADAARAAEPMKKAEEQKAKSDLDAAPMGEAERVQGQAWQPPAPPPPVRGPTVDWGGVVYLSNDDSASLASAQRLLYALDRNAGFTVNQIRPHELLNYFSFDTIEPSPGDVFGVTASAERVDHDTLSLALAVKGAKPPRKDLNLTVLLDRSGSMSAEGRMDYTRRALHKMSEQLHRGDRVNLVLFDHEICTPLTDFVVGRDDPSILRQVVDAIQPRGSTNLDLGMREAYRVATTQVAGDRASRMIVMTDAILNTGDINPETVSEVGRAFDTHGIRVTGVGVGSEFRDDVLNKITEKGKGAYVFLGSERVVDRLFGAGFDGLVQTIANDVQFALDLPPSLGMEKFYGEESSRRAEDVQPVNFQAGNSQLFLEDLAIQGGMIQSHEPIALTVSWSDPDTGARRQQTFSTTIGQALAADPHNSRKGRALIAWTDVLTAKAMGQDACGAAFQDYRVSMGGLEGDAEIAYVSELLGRWCGRPEPVARWTAPAYTKVRFESDVAVSEVELRCGGWNQAIAVTGSDKVATFEARAGSCDVTLHGNVPMTARITVPQTGGDVRCVARGGRMTCG